VLSDRRIRLLASTAAALLLAACAAAGPRFDVAAVDLRLTPERATAVGAPAQPTPVVWGGQIVGGTNFEDRTLLEVLGYPLDARQRPTPDAAPVGRFLVEYPGYLETVTYAPGRLMTASGVFQETRAGQVGELRYTYPVLIAEDLQLWPRLERRAEPRVHFGVGVLIRN
jgi:outer membrane lipoprotein